MSGPGDDRYPLGWILRPDDDEAFRPDGLPPAGLDPTGPPIPWSGAKQRRSRPRPADDSRAAEARGSRRETPSWLRPDLRPSASDPDGAEREARRAAGAHASPTSGPGAMASRRPPVAGPGALTPRTASELDGGAWGTFRRLLSRPADIISLVLLLGMVSFALTWALRLLGWR